MLSWNFQGRVLVLASKDDETSKKMLENYASLNATILDFAAFERAEIEDEKFDAVCMFLSAPSEFESARNVSFMYRTLSTVKRGGGLSVRMRLDKTNGEPSVEDGVGSATRVLTYAGFVDIKTTPDADFSSVQIAASRPEWKMGLSSAVKASTVDEELVDEASLLVNTGSYQTLGEGKSSCADKPRACANCSCGRAELEAKVGAEEAKAQLEGGGVRSSCGNCYLGDAFRCAGCPYKGQPAFRPGEKVVLDLDG